MSTKPKVYEATFKAKVALEALKEQKTISELTGLYGVHPTQINRWKQHVAHEVAHLFTNGKSLQGTEEQRLTEALYQKIGKLEMEVEFLKKKLGLLERV